MKRTNKLRRKLRHYRIRKKISGTPERPRICVHKTLKHLYVSVLDDTRDKGSATILNLTTNTKSLKSGGKTSFRNIENAKKLGKIAGETLKEKGFKSVVFDRAGYKYHGCVKAIADAVRETGVKI